MRQHNLAACCGVAAAFAVLQAAPGLAAQLEIAGASVTAYPNRPIRMLVGLPAGGSTDVIARIVASKLGDALGQHVIVDNRTGASGLIASEITAKAAPD